MSQKEVSLGEFLRYERELRGITIEQVASATKVGIRTLHALEADHYAELPAKPFVRGFVNSYCRFIGLDAKELLARFDDYMNSKAGERPNREAGHSGYAFEKRDGEQQSRTFLLIAIFGFVVVGGVAIVFLKPSFHHSRVSHADKLRAAHSGEMESNLSDVKSGFSNSSSAQAPPLLVGASPVLSSTSTSVSVVGTSNPINTGEPLKPVNDLKHEIRKGSLEGANNPVPEKGLAPKKTEKVSEGPVASQIETSEEESLAAVNSEDPLDSGRPLKTSEIQHKVIFKVLADIWVRYKVDSRPVRKFIIRKGNSLVLRAKDGVSVQVSNPKSVKFNYNNQGLKLMASEKNNAAQQEGALYFFPPKYSAAIESSKDLGGHLPKTPDPASEDGTGIVTEAKKVFVN